MRHVVLYRSCNSTQEDQDELAAIKSAGFHIITQRTQIQNDDLVIPRYSALPYYNELEQDCLYIKAKLINSYQQHLYIADLQNWVTDLKELTPDTWDDPTAIPDNCAFIVKGATNSKKGHWNTHCFASDKPSALEVYGKLSNDGLIGQQKIYFRRYIPLFKYGEDVQGMPITKEFRFFIYNGQIISSGFYWTNFPDIVNPTPDPSEVPDPFLKEVIARVGGKCPFMVVDVAQDQNGNWLVIELNDAAISGLSLNDPNIMYKNLFKLLLNGKL